eukprot:COSAG01_NODE_2670_length_7274_cov_4.395540_8_plen_109_part_00
MLHNRAGNGQQRAAAVTAGMQWVAVPRGVRARRANNIASRRRRRRSGCVQVTARTSSRCARLLEESSAPDLSCARATTRYQPHITCGRTHTQAHTDTSERARQTDANT